MSVLGPDVVNVSKLSDGEYSRQYKLALSLFDDLQRLLYIDEGTNISA